MITNFKIFEDNDNPYNIQVGDYVYYDDATEFTSLENNIRYKILKIYTAEHSYEKVCDIENEYGDKALYYLLSAFTPEIEHNTKKYNL